MLRKRWSADLIYFTVSQSRAGNAKDLLIFAACAGRLGDLLLHLHGGAGMRELLLEQTGLQRRLNEWLLPRVGGVVVLGPRLVPIYAKTISAERIHVVPNFAPDAIFLPSVDIQWKFLTTEPLRVLYLSNLLPGKGYLELLAALTQLPTADLDRLRIDFAGGFESASDELAFRAAIAPFKQIRYHGVVHGAEKIRLFHEAHVFCLPTYYAFEGQPISILEAYAAGCAVVTTDHSGIRDVFTPEENGYEVVPRSESSIAHALQRALSEPQKLSAIALHNHATAASNYRAESFCARLLDLCEGARGATRFPSIASSASSIGAPPHSIEKSARVLVEDSTPPSINTNAMSRYQICANCIMDTSDTKITFDARGFCDYCVNYREKIAPRWHHDLQNPRTLSEQIEQIKRDGRGREHDCLIGISGGVDSSYVTHLAKKEFGLRPLLFHVDAGWNSQQAVNNIEKLVDSLGLDLHTEVVNWQEMQDLQLAFFKAQVPHIDTPQDHAFFAGMYNFAAKNGFKYILTGANYSTECVREPLEWHYHASDLRQLKDIHRKYGNRQLKSFPLAGIFKFKLYYRYVKGVRVVKPLNHVPFIKDTATQLLVDLYGWQRYAHKHYESRFTRFYEGYWLPTKFGYDKRRAHFSSLVLTEQMSRADALERIAKPAYDVTTLAQDFEYIATKLNLTVDELRAIMAGPNKSYRDYANSMGLIDLGTKALRAVGVQRAIIR